MAKAVTRKNPKSREADKRQLAALATLIGLMQTASKFSAELDAMADEVGGSLEKIAEAVGVDFWRVHNTYVEQTRKKPQSRKGRTAKRSAKV